jgi:hypothetical protein
LCLVTQPLKLGIPRLKPQVSYFDNIPSHPMHTEGFYWFLSGFIVIWYSIIISGEILKVLIKKSPSLLILYVTYSTTHQRSVEVQFGRYQKNILQEWYMVKNLSFVSCGSLKRFPHTFTTHRSDISKNWNATHLELFY